MDSKYSNIFWHQGVKIYEEEVLKSKQGRLRVSHLENDVTKVLLNLFQYCSKGVLSAFLQLVGVREAPDTFDFDFQVIDSNKYRNKNKRIMLSIISSSTQKKSDTTYSVTQSRPDACLFNKNTAILIEVKTQSPLITEQIESHVKHYLGTATDYTILTWEDITEKFNILKKNLPMMDQFFLEHFCDFMELIGVAEFRGFLVSDFSMIGSIERIPNEEYLDYLRVFKRKVQKFMTLLGPQLKSEFRFMPYRWQTKRVEADEPDFWSAFYFFDKKETKKVNDYPNINFNYKAQGIELSLNAEIQKSFKMVFSSLKKTPNKFNQLSKTLNGFSLSLYYKMEFRIRKFFWNLVPGFPINMENLQASDVLIAIDDFTAQWMKWKRTLLFQMKSGILRHPTGRFFTENELNHASKQNITPNYVIRVEKRYAPDQIDDLRKKIVPYFIKEIQMISTLAEFIISRK